MSINKKNNLFVNIFAFNKIPGKQINNIHYFVKNINRYKNKNLIIAGGDDSAIDWAIELCNC